MKLDTLKLKVGPFANAAKSLEQLAANLYFNGLYMQTLEELQKTQKEYDLAVLAGDEEVIAQKRSELVFIEEIMKLSAINYDSYADGGDEMTTLSTNHD